MYVCICVYVHDHGFVCKWPCVCMYVEVNVRLPVIIILLSSDAGSLIFTWSSSVWPAWPSNEPQGSTCFDSFSAIIDNKFLFGFYLLSHPQFVTKIHFPATYNPSPFLPQHHQEPEVVKLNGDCKVGQFSFLRS